MANKAFYKGAIWSILDNFIKQAFTFIIFIILARLLAPEIIGLMAFTMLFVQVLKNVVFDSIATAIIRKPSPSDHDYHTGFVMCILISVPAFLILFFSSDFIEEFIGDENLSAVIKATSLIILTAGLGRMHEAWLQHQMKFQSLAIRSSISTFIGGIIGIVLAYKGFGIYSLVAQQMSTALLELALIWIITPWKPKFKFRKKAYIEIRNYGKHVALTGLTNFANQNSDSFFVTYYLGTAATGIYSTGKRVITTVNTIISSSLLRVSLPAFAKIANDKDELRRTFLNTTALTAFVTAPLFGGLSILSKDITLLLLGEKWIASAPVMQIVTLTGFLFSIGYYNQSVMLVKNKPDWQTKLTVLYALTNIIAFILFTKYGIVETALAFAIRALILYPISVWCALTLIESSWKAYINKLWPSIFSTILMMACVYFTSNLILDWQVINRIILQVIVGLISYICFIYIFIPKDLRNSVLNGLKVKLRKAQ